MLGVLPYVSSSATFLQSIILGKRPKIKSEGIRGRGVEFGGLPRNLLCHWLLPAYNKEVGRLQCRWKAAKGATCAEGSLLQLENWEAGGRHQKSGMSKPVVWGTLKH